MAHALTETPANADFVTPVTVPDTGDNGSTWWNILISLFQRNSDRNQWLKAWQADNPKIVIPLAATFNTSSRFSLNSFGVYYTQTDITSNGLLGFNIPPLPIGRKITAITARWQNDLAVGLPGTGHLPTITLSKYLRSAGTDINSFGSASIVSATDASSSLAAYQTLHDITATCSEVITENSLYYATFSGENATAGGILAMIYLTLGL